jgi:hypothetical protein
MEVTKSNFIIPKEVFSCSATLERTNTPVCDFNSLSGGDKSSFSNVPVQSCFPVIVNFFDKPYTPTADERKRYGEIYDKVQKKETVSQSDMDWAIELENKVRNSYPVEIEPKDKPTLPQDDMGWFKSFEAKLEKGTVTIEYNPTLEELNRYTTLARDLSKGTNPPQSEIDWAMELEHKIAHGVGTKPFEPTQEETERHEKIKNYLQDNNVHIKNYGPYYFLEENK